MTTTEKKPGWLGRKIRAEEFDPGLIGLFTNPTYFVRKSLFQHIRHFGPQLTGRLLDIGCGTKPYSHLFPNAEYTGMEIDTPEGHSHKKADVFYDGKHFPFSDGEFNSAITSQVLEHVFNPDEFIAEIARVLKPGGKLLVTVPFLWEEHEQPYDFGRYSSFGLAHILEKHGFRIVEQKKSVTGVRALAQLQNSYLRRKVRVKNRKLRLLVNVVVFGAVNILGIIFSAILPDHTEMYLDNIVLAERV